MLTNTDSNLYIILQSNYRLGYRCSQIQIFPPRIFFSKHIPMYILRHILRNKFSYILAFYTHSHKHSYILAISDRHSHTHSQILALSYRQTRKVWQTFSQTGIIIQTISHTNLWQRWYWLAEGLCCTASVSSSSLSRNFCKRFKDTLACNRKHEHLIPPHLTTPLKFQVSSPPPLHVLLKCNVSLWTVSHLHITHMFKEVKQIFFDGIWLMMNEANKAQVKQIQVIHLSI